MSTQPLSGIGAVGHGRTREAPARAWTRTLLRRPAIGFELATAVAWMALIATMWRELFSPHTLTTPSIWWCMPGMSSGSRPVGFGMTVLTGLPMWTLMSAAMMLPATIPEVRRARSHPAGSRAVALPGGYLAVWIAFGAAALALRFCSSASPRVALIAAVTLAAAWQITPHKRRALEYCRRESETARFGMRAGISCLASCWAMMLVMAMARSDQLIWAFSITVAVVAEKLTREPSKTVQCTAAILAAVAVDLTFAATVG
jgi:predicted metal-binding membrane protein